MTISPLTNILPNLFQIGSNSSKTNSSAASQTAATTPQDASPSISPIADFLSQLQQLQQQNPAEFQQVAANIGQQLQTEAQAAQGQGNTAKANQLNQLASVFASAAQTGQVPTAQQLSQGGFSGHHHHHHHGGGSSGQTNPFDSTSSASSSSSGTSTDASLQTLLSNAFNTLGIAAPVQSN